jgi:uncharacterized membrane protein YecN with MAPEG domain
MTITPFYAGLLALLFIYLSLRVIGRRQATRTSLGDGGDSLLMRRLRAHANFAEYVPLALILMALAELQGVSGWGLHTIGLCLVTGRVVHARALSREPEPAGGRVLGMLLTFAAMASAALTTIGLTAMAILDRLG